MPEHQSNPPVRGVHRAMCLAVRASDTRLVEFEGVVHPDVVVAKYRRGSARRRALGLELARDVVGVEVKREAHAVILDGGVIRDLCRPVWLRQPGVALTRAAALLGRHPEAMRKWLPMRPGRDRATRAAVASETVFGRLGWHVEDAVRQSHGVAAQSRGHGAGGEERVMRSAGWREPGCGGGGGAVLSVRYEPASVHRLDRRGVEVPVVWADGPLDPSQRRGMLPFAGWADWYEQLSASLPLEYTVELERVPRYERYGSGSRFRGWQWVCPGRRVAGVGGWRGQLGCGRRVRTLFTPVDWGVLDKAGEHPAALLRKAERIDAGLTGSRGLACERCWGVRWD